MNETKTHKRGAISGVRRNIMGTVSFGGLFAGMRKPQEFIVYPIPSGKDWDGIIDVQSETRFGEINTRTGEVVMSPPKSGGAYAITLTLAKVRREVVCSQLDPDTLRSLCAAITSTAGRQVGSRGIVTDNGGAVALAAIAQ